MKALTLADLLSIQNSVSLLQTAVERFIVRPNGSGFSQGISGFVFDIMGPEEIALEADITDHYVEANYAIQDHIAIRPEKYIMRGYVGDLSNTLERADTAQLGALQTLALVPGFSPDFVQGALEVYESILVAYQNARNVVQQAQSLYQLFNQKGTASTKQQAAYNYFYGLWATRQLCTVETPYQVFENMAIESVRPVQNEETKSFSDFSVTFKKIRTASTIVSLDVIRSIGRAANLYAPLIEKGKSVGQPADQIQLALAFPPAS